MINDNEIDSVAKVIAGKLGISINSVKRIYENDKLLGLDYDVCGVSGLDRPVVERVRAYLKEFSQEEDNGVAVEV